MANNGSLVYSLLCSCGWFGLLRDSASRLRTAFARNVIYRAWHFPSELLNFKRGDCVLNHKQECCASVVNKMAELAAMYIVQVTETDGMSAGDWQPPSADAELVPSTLSFFLLLRRRRSSLPSRLDNVWNCYYQLKVVTSSSLIGQSWMETRPWNLRVGPYIVQWYSPGDEWCSADTVASWTINNVVM